MKRVASFIGALALFGCAQVARADEPHGCDGFKWPIAHARDAIADPTKPAVAPGDALAFDAAATLKLAPFAEAKLDRAPERAAKPDTFAGLLRLPAPQAAGVFAVTIASEAWIDVIQDGAYLKPIAFSGALDCEGARKSVKFRLAAKPTTLQISNARAGELSLIVAPE